MALEQQDLEEIAKLIAANNETVRGETTKMLNGALAKLGIKEMREKLAALPDADAVAAKAKEVADAALAEAAAKKQPEGGKGKEPGAPGIDDETKRMLDELKKANEKLVKDLDKQKAEREKETAQRRDAEERTALQTTLSKAEGFKVTMIETAMDHLRARGHIKRNEAGEIVFERKDQTGSMEQVALEDGIGGWLKTDVGKEFLAPKKAGGSGDHKVGRRVASGADAESGAVNLGDLLNQAVTLGGLDG